MVKKNSPTNEIESAPHPNVESVFVKTRRGSLKNITDYSKSTEFDAGIIPGRILEKHAFIHTHPAKIQEVKRTYSPNMFFCTSKSESYKESDISAILSWQDIETFLTSGDNRKSSIVAVREPDSGVVRGYTFVRKTKKTPHWTELMNNAVFNKDIHEYKGAFNNKGTLVEEYSAFKEIMKKYGLQYRFVPVKGYNINEYNTHFVRKGDLDQRVSSAVALAGGAGGIFFLSGNFTGNVVANLSNSTSSWIGAVLFLIGLVGVFFWVKSKRK